MVNFQKHGDIMMLARVLVKNTHYVRSRNGKTQLRRTIQKQRKILGGLFARPNIKQGNIWKYYAEG